jgi:hypothetical protein
MENPRDGAAASESPVRFAWEDWVWDDTVFRGAAQYYPSGRFPYAPGLAEALARHLGLDGHGRLLDVPVRPA